MGFHRIVFAMALALGSIGCGSTWKREPLRGQGEIQIYREFPTDHADSARFAHPAMLSREDVHSVLARLQYVPKSIIKDPEVSPVFRATEAEQLAGLLVESMAELAPEERLRFLVRRPSLRSFLVGPTGVSGVAFCPEAGKLSLAFDAIGTSSYDWEGEDYEDSEDYNFPHEPTAKSFVQLVASPEARLHVDPTSGRVITSWIDVDLGAVEKREVTESAPADKKVPEVAQPPVETEPQRPETEKEAPPPRDAVERLKLLERLRKEGLITEEEYQSKRRTILDGL